ncbi:unnamed protein product [Litomosoides sigmodontis]|uniref:Uncharacterized protein n=1 Tax=Litomosoides sigmodontis TaxID=42156 RepID=A0A3P6T6Z4_LITSI|nr:unnamed protein product [Litomosoides sigmodontis]
MSPSHLKFAVCGNSNTASVCRRVLVGSFQHRRSAWCPYRSVARVKQLAFILYYLLVVAAGWSVAKRANLSGFIGTVDKFPGIKSLLTAENAVPTLAIAHTETQKSFSYSA